MDEIEVRPVTAAKWEDLARLFEGRGGPHYCWCSLYRFSNAGDLSKAQKKESMRQLVTSAVPVGVLAYEGTLPVGWCSVAPRQTYARLDRSRKMPRVTPAEVSTWTVLCFFVLRAHRRRGVCERLLLGAIRYARSLGAEVIEAYPFDTAGMTAAHRGHSSVFDAAGFQRDGIRWSRDLRAAQPDISNVS